MYCLPTPISGVHPHQVMDPDVAESLEPPPSDPLHPLSAKTTAVTAATVAIAPFRQRAPLKRSNIIVLLEVGAHAPGLLGNRHRHRGRSEVGSRAEGSDDLAWFRHVRIVDPRSS